MIKPSNAFKCHHSTILRRIPSLTCEISIEITPPPTLQPSSAEARRPGSPCARCNSRPRRWSNSGPLAAIRSPGASPGWSASWVMTLVIFTARLAIFKSSAKIGYKLGKWPHSSSFFLLDAKKIPTSSTERPVC